MLNGYFGRLVPLLEQDGGVVHQIVGDAVMVIFNQHGDQPDHAARAVRTALAFQAAAAEIASDHPDWPRFRAGVNSGEVLAGLVGGAERPSQARRRRRHGEPGRPARVGRAGRPGGRRGRDCGRPPAGRRARAPPPLELKGKGEPVEASSYTRCGRLAGACAIGSSRDADILTAA